MKQLTKTSSRRSVKMTLVIMCINLLGSIQLKSQLAPFNRPLDLSIHATNVMWLGANLVWEHNLSNNPRTWSIKGIDNGSQQNLNNKTAKISDVVLVGSMVLSGLQALGPNKDIRWNYVNLLSQNLMVTLNTTQSIKLAFQRTRPYTQSPQYNSLESKTDDRLSFFSGHSSMTASAATTAMIIAFKYEDKNWMKYTALAGSALTLTTAYLRVRAGKHYPSDVIAGLVVGTGISLLNAYIHENRQ